MNNNILIWLKGILLYPAQTIQEINREKPIAWAIVVYVVSTLLFNIGAEYITPGTIPHFNAQFMTGLFIDMLVSIIALFVFSYLLSKYAHFVFSGKGEFWGLFCAIGFTNLPAVLGGLVIILYSLLYSADGLTTLYFGFLVILATTVWIFVLAVISIRESQELSTATSVGVLISHLVLLLVLIFVFVIVVLPIFFYSF